ncbi:HD domain-containing protein [Brachybacterium horti]
MELEGLDLVARAQSIARRAHEGQTDKLGEDYIAHPQRVAECALYMAPAKDRFDCVAAGWLHDVVEDSEVTLEDLRSHGMPDRILDAVDCLTKRDGTSRADYFARIREHRIARVVKAADLAENCDPDRAFRLPSSTRYRLSAKYAESWAMLMGVTS